MDGRCLGVYKEPEAHEAVSGIIRSHSTNGADVRWIALQGVDLAGSNRLLDLGCGFGFMAEALVGRIPPHAELIGIDIHPSNREAFLVRAGWATGSARFECVRLDKTLAYPDRSIDAITASYSLYFFPELIPEIARVLKPDGAFIALTHSESAFAGLSEELGLSLTRSELHGALLRFSAENGESRLAPYFADVEVRPYRNRLVFEASDLQDLVTMIGFKLPLLLPVGAGGPDPSAVLLQRARRLLEDKGRVVIAKDDAAFVARKPRQR